MPIATPAKARRGIRIGRWLIHLSVRPVRRTTGDVPILTAETGVRFVRTPDERFENLPGYPFEPHYAVVEGLRMHYVDEGPRNGQWC